jgi:hypothetical protein
MKTPWFFAFPDRWRLNSAQYYWPRRQYEQAEIPVAGDPADSRYDAGGMLRSDAA